MYELNQVGARSYYIQSPVKIGIYAADNGVYLIDSGIDKDMGRRIRRILDERGWNLLGILNTHSNSDHIGGNAYLQKQTGCKIFSGGIEKCFTEHTILEPAFLYGGFPCADLRHKFLLAEESEVTDFSAPEFPSEVEIIPLPGHFFDMVGFRTPDDVVFLADCLSSRATLEKYGITFIYDVAEYLKTLESVKKMKAKMFIPSHADAAENITELAQFNIDKVNEIARKILAICSEPMSFESILARLFTEYGLKMTFEQNVLVGSTVRSYLAWLRDSGRVEILFEDNYMVFRRCQLI
ncbi:MAG: MBL fold metallo-hydrolase [Oscillospiraceae bacterium]|nr:MBL fold metallo-hydrolase [Oscillospiraceae bacterium]